VALADELTSLQVRGSDLCLAIVGPPNWAPMPKWMWVASTHHTEMARQHVKLHATVSSCS
jgi:hypothetical protein